MDRPDLTRAGSSLFDAYYSGKRVLVTGASGFKGSWLCTWLALLGGEVHALGLDPEDGGAMFTAIEVSSFTRYTNLDIRDSAALERHVSVVQPDVIFHLAAQSLVRRSYARPLETVSTNVLGTANVLAAASALVERRGEPCAVVIVTSDKCYLNMEDGRAYEEFDPLGGRDLYSASKAAADILASAWQHSFGDVPSRGATSGVSIATCRAGNVIGGGDWAEDRVVPDCVRALAAGDPIRIRHPQAIRPWQHVLEPLSGYLLVGSLLTSGERAVGAWNFGPGPDGERTVAELCDRIVGAWGLGSWVQAGEPGAPPESGILRLAVERARDILGWSSTWDFDRAVDMTLEWYRAALSERNAVALRQLTQSQIQAYVDDARRGGRAWATGGHRK